MQSESGVSDGRALIRAAAIAAALLVVGLSAAPALGQDGQNGDDVVAGDDIQYRSVCQNIIGAISVAQSQSGDAAATATSGGGGTDDGNGGGSARAVAQVAQAQGVSVAQANECLNAADRPSVKAATVTGQKGEVLAATIPKKPLPDTGGMPLLALVAALGLVAIVAGVLVLRAVMSRRA